MQLWIDFLNSLEKELGSATIDRWLRPLRLLKFDACNIYFEAKNSFQILWFEEHIRQKAAKKLINNSGKPIKVHISLAQEQSPGEKKNSAKPKSFSKENERYAPTFTLNFDSLYPQATFDSFTPLESYKLAYKLLCHTAGYCLDANAGAPHFPAELSVYNPIYLYGHKGTGKTHLLMAVTAELRKKGLQALYVHANTFTEHVVAAIRSGEMSAFRQAYRTIDVLLIDDVHFFSGKAATQEELFHTFNTLHVASKQIILSSQCAPSELSNIEARLISRFEWGISLLLPSHEQKELEQILQKKTETLNFPLHPSVIEFLIQTFQDSKSLTQALEALILRSHMQKRVGVSFSSTQITVSQAKYYLNDLIRSYCENSLTPEKILEAVGQTFGIRRDDILGKAKNREYVLPRQLAMYLCRKQLKLPFKKIGELFNKDHSTVMASVKLIQEGIESSNESICQSYQCLAKFL